MYRSAPCCLVQARKEVELPLPSGLAAARWEAKFARREVVSSVLDFEERTTDGPPTMMFLCHCQKKKHTAFVMGGLPSREYQLHRGQSRSFRPWSHSFAANTKFKRNVQGESFQISQCFLQPN